jgi:hypothetical protein
MTAEDMIPRSEVLCGRERDGVEDECCCYSSTDCPTQNPKRLPFVH